MNSRRCFLHVFPLLIALFAEKAAWGQGTAIGLCKPVSQRTQEVGCWILSDQPMGQLKKAAVFWRLDTYATREQAEAAKTSRGTVVESMGKVWLLTIEDRPSRANYGSRVAEIGPLPVVKGENYSAQYMEAVFDPGMTSNRHTHSGPEAWYTVAGETCLESSDGRMQTGRAGGQPVIVPGGLSMHLTATGKEQRRALVLILHESAKPHTTLVQDWTPKGLCKPEAGDAR
ncbi:MAG TPA: hypothetical protein VKW06_10705 [Candidatus Angelobacter sp.]|nr:hypothetical protein [Candidatus Angelobacter sp.]